MNSATLKTLRELVGLSQQQAADLVGVSLRSWQYWESPTGPNAKPDVAAALVGRLTRIQDVVDSIPDYNRMSEPPTEVVVTRYRSEADLNAAHPGYPGGLVAHAAAIRQIVARLDSLGVEGRVVWDNDPDATIRAGL